MANKNFGRLPEACATRNPETGDTILIKRGESGYYPLTSDIDPDQFNADNDITSEQVQAMVAGSMFGWDCPAADPQTYSK